MMEVRMVGRLSLREVGNLAAACRDETVPAMAPRFVIRRALLRSN